MKYPLTFNYSASVRAPLTFVAVPGTRMDQLVPSYGPQYKERGTVGTQAIFQAWIGCARRGDDLIFLHPGGHNDTNFNGDIAYNRKTKLWRMLNLPSDFGDAVWGQSVALWGGSRANVNICDRYDPAGDEVWKDGRPCSMHCYGLVVDAEEFGVFHLRKGIWRYDSTWKATKLPGVGSSPDAGPDAYAFYSRVRKKIYLCGDSSSQGIYGRIWEVDPTTGTVTMTGLVVKQWNGEACELEGGGKAYLFNDYWHESSLIDFDAGVVTSKPPLSFAGDALVTLIHSNKTGLLAIRASGTLATVGMDTGQVVNVGPSGIPATLLAVSAARNGTWGRCKLTGTIAANDQSFVFPIETNSDVYEMVI